MTLLRVAFGPSLSIRRATIGAVDADRPLKKLLTLRAGDLLPVTGDRGARVLSRVVPEVAAVSRRLDFVLKLKRGSEVYLRHLEFETRCRRGLAAMRLGLGGAALVGLTSRRSLRVLEAAAHRIRTESPAQQCADLSAILRGLSEGRYTGRELERVVPREVVMSSSLFAEVRRRSRAEGREEGRQEGRQEGREEGLEKGLQQGKVVGIRAACESLVRQLHPTVLSEVAPAIQACPDAKILLDWVRAAPQMADSEFVRLVKAAAPAAPSAPASRSARVRVPRPSRRARTRR